MRPTTYLLTVNQPDDVSDEQMAGYIEDAVSSWGGQFPKDDPLFRVEDVAAQRFEIFGRAKKPVLSST